jgi:outer membrane lipase/esterase
MFFQANLGRFAARAVAGLVATAALASCGGGTYQVESFVPARILTFGDESNMIYSTKGLKYSVNGISSSSDQIDCSLNKLWTQVLAASYTNMVYANCNTEAVAETYAVDMSTLDATVDDVQSQVDAFTAGDTFNSSDLVTIWVGAHDILTEYEANGSSDDEATLVADMHTAGANLAAIVNSIAATGAKVILLTAPDMGDSPYAYTEQQIGDFDREGLLSAMTTGFNLGLRANIVNDGSEIGLVLVDNFVQNAVRSPSSYGLISAPNATAGCQSTVSLPNCTDDTIVTNAAKDSNATSIYLWADSTHLAPTAHTQIGNLAVSRAHSNPF